MLCVEPSLLSDTTVYEPQIRARLGTTHRASLEGRGVEAVDVLRRAVVVGVHRRHRDLELCWGG